MDFFDRHKALIITTLIFLILILTMYNINISNENRRVRETLIDLNDLRQEKLPQEEPQPEEEAAPRPKKQPGLKTHQAYNQDQQEPSPDVNSRLKEIFKKNAARQKAATEEGSTTSGEFVLPKQDDNKTNQRSEGDRTTRATSVQKGNLRNSSIAFSLLGRQAIDIPNPVYTCDTAGKVVINITVNTAGEVTETSFNERASSTSNECLVEQALQYAAGAKFSELRSRRAQPGTITYYFQD